MRNHWRRFVPKRKPEGIVLDDGSHLNTIRSVTEANTYIDELKQLPVPHDQKAAAHHYRTLLLAQTPRAVVAQWQMDAHKHGYRDREKRLYELIDFNDTFVSLILVTQQQDLPGFIERLKTDMDAFCKRLSTPAFTADQFDAISRGLGREIAVYRAAKQVGFSVYMTSRTEDAFGIDMVITHHETRRELNIDCKTPSAFRRRLEELVERERITDADLLKADNDHFITLPQQRGHETIPVTLMCILPDVLGEIHDFMFDDPHRLEELLNNIFITQAHSERKEGLAKTRQSKEKMVA